MTLNFYLDENIHKKIYFLNCSKKLFFKQVEFFFFPVKLTMLGAFWIFFPWNVWLARLRKDLSHRTISLCRVALWTHAIKQSDSALHIAIILFSVLQKKLGVLLCLKYAFIVMESRGFYKPIHLTWQIYIVKWKIQLYKETRVNKIFMWEEISIYLNVGW